MLAETLRFLLTGSSALVMHNSRLVDPLDPWSREIAAITGKRHKTISDYEQLAKAEFYGSAWLDHDRPCIPATVIEGLLVAAAKTRRRGSQARSGIVCPAHVGLTYDGPETLDGLWKDERFRLRIPVRTPGGRVMRTRPLFPEWRAEVEVKFLTSLVDAEAVEGWFKLGGELLGIGDFRPRHGRFSVERLPVVSPIGSVSLRIGRAGQASPRQGAVESAGEEHVAPLPSPERSKRKRKI
jgi:hypothetical protein